SRAARDRPARTPCEAARAARSAVDVRFSARAPRRPARGAVTPLAEPDGMPAWWKTVSTFARSALTGGLATLVDLGVIAFAVGVLGVSPAVANVPALLLGAVVQFFGNRCFAFKARSGALGRQAGLFVLTEAVTMALNGALYHVVVT